MPHLTRRAALMALTPALLNHARSATAVAPATDTLPGTGALPDTQARVSATLTVSPSGAGAPSGTRLLDVTMTELGATRPVTRYEVELSKRLHLIAVSDDLKTFLHEHGERPGPDGHFRVSMPFPRGGGWHVFADAVPAGLGQQVMRFEVNLDRPGSSPASPIPRPGPPPPTGLEGANGRYAARFDALDLRAGKDEQLGLHVLRDGKPAPDLTPFLGVAAHAVFISAADLSYIHAHAAPAVASTPGMSGMDHGDEHGSMPGMGAPMRAGTKVTPDLTLHVQAPKAGTYLLWVQFMAGGRVRTVPFVIVVG